jgi:uncharacterized membrane protein YecN with MAPEG domain
MIFPALTAAYAAVLALIFAVLSAWVVAGRFAFRVNHGDGGNAALLRRIRSHANFAEYVPLTLLLVALLEAGGAGRLTIHALLLPLVVARIAHPIGMVARDFSRQQFTFRGPASVVTWLVMVVAAVLLLVRYA